MAVPLPELNVELAEVLAEEDLLRLVIKGHAAVEKALDEALAKAFTGGEIPKELASLRFKTRLALAEAVGIPVGIHVGTIVALSKLRNEFAHGTIDDLTEERARLLVNEMSQGSPNDFSVLLEETGSPRNVLVAALMLSYGAVRVAGYIAEAQREEAKARTVELEARVEELLQGVEPPQAEF